VTAGTVYRSLVPDSSVRLVEDVNKIKARKFPSACTCDILLKIQQYR